MTTYDFDDQMHKGDQGEQFLDAKLARWFRITPASRDEQRSEIDRWFERGGQKWAVEYKTDTRARYSHNAFIETVSVDTAHKLGWVHTSLADWLVYYVPGDEMVYVVEFETLRERLPAWALRYPSKAIPNKAPRGDTYNTIGLLVPLHELERIAIYKHSF